MSDSTVRVRIAPSPTGDDLHLGTANTALVCYIFAKQRKGKFVVRIEDTDRTRFVEGATERILESLKWLGLFYDEGPDVPGEYGPYIQSERTHEYQRYAQQLIDSGSAYYCFCSPEEINAIRKERRSQGLPPMYDGRCKSLDPTEVQKRLREKRPHVIRLNVPKEGETSFVDLIHGEIRFKNNLIDDQILIKSDGFPTYHMAVVVDDHLMKISHVIRGEDWIPSTPKHVLLYNAFGWELPLYAHVPLLRNKDKSKLSKRKDPVFISWYREQGFLPQAIINYLGTLLVPRADGSEKFSLQELIDSFELTSVNTTGPAWDRDKLMWLNGQYIRELPVDELASLLVREGFVDEEYAANSSYYEQVVALAQERLKLLSEFWDENRFFFEEPQVDIDLVYSYIDDDTKRREYLERVVESLDSLNGLEGWNTEILETELRAIQKEYGLKPKAAFMTLRVAISGQTHTPPLFDMMAVLGKEVVLKRIRNAI